MDEENIEMKISSLTVRQRDKIYKDMLEPLKHRISQILLYDTKTAVEFLQEYNKLTENDDMTLDYFWHILNELELKITQYEKAEGESKLNTEQGIMLLRRIEDLSVHADQYSSEEFEREFSNIKSTYDTIISDIKYKDRENLEEKIYSLKVKLLINKVKDGKTALTEEILPEEEAKLIILVNNEINMLENSSNSNTKKMVNHIKGIMMTSGNDVIYKPKIWKMLDAARRGIIISDEQTVIYPKEETALTTTRAKDSIFNKMKKFFRKEPALPLQMDEVHKVNLNWLAKQIPISMLQEIEENRLKEEGKNVEEMFMPDARIPIYERLQGLSWDEVVEKVKNTKTDKLHYDYIDESGIKKILEIKGTTDICITDEFGQNTNIRMGFPEDLAVLVSSLEYAGMLDDITGSQLLQRIVLEAEEIIEKELQSGEDVFCDIFRGNKDFNRLYSGFAKMRKELIEETKDFKALEEKRRKQFYETHSFKDGIKVDIKNLENDTRSLTETDKESINDKVGEYTDQEEK